MSRKPDIETTRKMYELYEKGFSCTKVAEAFGVTRQTVHKRFKRQHLYQRKIEALPFIRFQGKKYTLRANGYYGRTKGKRNYLHRDIWESVNGKIPDGFDIHHKDGDKTYNTIENYELYSKAEHARKFGVGQNQYTKKDE